MAPTVGAQVQYSPGAITNLRLGAVDTDRSGVQEHHAMTGLDVSVPLVGLAGGKAVVGVAVDPHGDGAGVLLEVVDEPVVAIREGDVADPEELKSDMQMRREMADKLGDRLNEAQRKLMLRPRPVEMRTLDKLHWMNSEPKEPRAHSWFRTAAPLPDDPALHRAVITYASDYTLLGTSALPHGLSWMRGELVGASLDHAIWFHREARADEWLLYCTDAPWSGGGRGYNRGRIYNRAGELVASVAQEGMMRRRKGS